MAPSHTINFPVVTENPGLTGIGSSVSGGNLGKLTEITSNACSVELKVCEESYTISTAEEDEHLKRPTPIAFAVEWSWWWQKYRGILLAFTSSLIFSFTALLVKQLHGHNPITIALWRYQGALWPGIACFIFHRNFGSEKEKENILEPITPFNEASKQKMLFVLLVRSVLTCNALLLHFYSLKYLNIADAIVIGSATPIAVTILSHFFLHESCGIVPVIAAFLSCTGVVIISKPPLLTGAEEFDIDILIGLCLGLGSMLLASLSFILLRYLRKVHYTITTVAFSLWGTLENLTLALGFGVFSVPEGSDRMLATCLVFLTFAGQSAIIFATKYELASVVALVRTLDCIFCFFLQYVFLDVHLNSFSVIGSSVVVSGVVITAVRKYLFELPMTHPQRKYFFFLLK